MDNVQPNGRGFLGWCCASGSNKKKDSDNKKTTKKNKEILTERITSNIEHQMSQQYEVNTKLITS